MEGQCSRAILQIALTVFSLHLQTGSAANAILTRDNQDSQPTISYCPADEPAVVGFTAKITRDDSEKAEDILDFKVGYQTADHVEPDGLHQETDNLTDVFTFNMEISLNKTEVHCSYILGTGDRKPCDNSLTVAIDSNSTCTTASAPTSVATTAATTEKSTTTTTTQAPTEATTTQAATTAEPSTTTSSTTEGIGPGRPNAATPKPEPKDNTKLYVVFFAAGAVILVGVLAYCYLCAVAGGRNTADRLVQLQPEHKASPGPTPSTTIITVPEPVYIETPVFVEAPQPMYEEPYYGPPGPGFDAPLPPGFAAPPPPGFGGPQPPPFYPTHQDGSVVSDRGSMQLYQYPAPDGSVREGSVTSDRSYGSRQSYSRRH